MARVTRLLLAVLIATAGLCLAAKSSGAETRRAFVVGINKYKNGIRELTLPTQDAADVAKTLGEINFDPKNVEVYSDPPTREAFLARFNKFLETVQKDDVVFFYFSGHGVGGDDGTGQHQNYLLFPDARSDVEFARTQLSEADKRIPGTLEVLLNSDDFKRGYVAKEIGTHSVTEKEILNLINQKLPRVAIVVIDACRDQYVKSKGAVRAATRGTSVMAATNVPTGFMVIYSASHGQRAIERVDDNDKRRNSLFTAEFRDYLTRPGLDITQIAKRVRDRVSLLAANLKETQDPDFIDNIRNGDFYFIEPAGQQLRPTIDPCENAAAHLRPLRQRPTREGLDEHLKLFGKCTTAQEAMKLRDQLAHGTFDKIERASVLAGARVNPCDRFAASDEDQARPPDVPGVRFDRINPDQAVPACIQAVEDNPRVVRYLFNLAAAYQQQGILLAANSAARQEAERNAVFRYQDVVKRGYVAAFNNLAIMYDNGQGVAADAVEATRLFRLGADQGQPLAIYNLALRYKLGKGGLVRNSERAYELLAKAAEAGNIDAMVEVGRALRRGYGVDTNPTRAREWLERAANAGSNEAKRELGLLYFFGGQKFPKDDTQALLWFAQAAEANDAVAQYIMADMFAHGWGIASPQPQIAERYWRLAAYNGLVEAQLEFAERLLSSRILMRPENAADEAVQLLKLAMRLGSSRAALRLAKVYRNGELGFAKRPKDAVGFAFEAIDLASQSNSSTRFASFSDHPLDEVAAGILLVEMAANGEAVDADGTLLLKPEMVARLERYYGRPDPETKRVKVRSLKVEMDCGGAIEKKFIWVWDWGRDESPTEAQFRYYENQNPPCRPAADSQVSDTRKTTRDTLNALWQTVHKDGKISFADIVFAQSQQTSSTRVEEPRDEPPSRRRRRSRR